MLELSAVSKHFGGVQAVVDLTLTVPEGQITGIIGPNGAGKTTVFNLVTGFLAPTAGRIRLDGHDLARCPPHVIARRGLARTFQTPRLFRGMSTWENVVVGQNRRAARGPGLLLPRSANRALVDEARRTLELVGLWEARERPAAALSYGDQRRLEIARALAARPRMLLLDEPAAGMNPVESDALLAVLDTIRASGVTLLLIEHDMSVVMNLCDGVAVLNFGRKIAEGTPDQVQADPRVLEAYLGQDTEPAGAGRP